MKASLLLWFGPALACYQWIQSNNRQKGWEGEADHFTNKMCILIKILIKEKGKKKPQHSQLPYSKMTTHQHFGGISFSPAPSPQHTHTQPAISESKPSLKEAFQVTSTVRDTVTSVMKSFALAEAHVQSSSSTRHTRPGTGWASLTWILRSCFSPKVCSDYALDYCSYSHRDSFSNQRTLS